MANSVNSNAVDAAETHADLAHAETEANLSRPPHAGNNPSGSPHTGQGTHAPPGANRRLQAKPSIAAEPALKMGTQMCEKPLKAAELRTLGGLENLAAEHVHNFKQLVGPGGRPIAPMHTVRIATACTGSAADRVSLSAVRKALHATLPGFDFEYVFNCEQHSTKRKWIQSLHDVMEEHDRNNSKTSAPGQARDKPCLFADIQDLARGEQCPCYAHVGRKNKPGLCPVGDFDILICSTSCKEFSKMNPKTFDTTILKSADSAGGSSVQTFIGLCDLLEKYRPDILIWENVEDVGDTKQDGETNLECILQQWGALGYESQVAYCNSRVYGLPQNLHRCYIVAFNVRDPKTITFEDRSIDDVCCTFTSLLQVCQRKAECASTYLLDDGDKHVRHYLKHLQAEAAQREEKGYNMQKHVEIALKAGIKPGSYPPPASLANNKWFQTLTMQQKDTLSFSMVYQQGPHFFRDVRPSFGRTRISSRGDHDEAIAGTVLPSQMLMTFREPAPGHAGDPEPRLILGRENLLLQGFPIDIIENMPGNFKETNFTELAGNMVSTPVFLAMFMTAMASVSWVPQDEALGDACSVGESCVSEDAEDKEEAKEEDDLFATVFGGIGAAEKRDGLLEGPPSLKRKGGLLHRVYSKVPKTDDAPPSLSPLAPGHGGELPAPGHAGEPPACG